MCVILAASAVMTSAVPVFATDESVPENIVPVQEQTEEASAQEGYSAYVFAYFRRPPGSRDDERLCLGVSRDGYSFRALNGGEPVFQSSKEHTPGIQYEGAFRDPYIMRGEDGKFYIVVTDLLGTGNRNHQITIYPTEDLINFEQGIVVDYAQYEGFEDTNRAWAPQIIWCPEHDNGDGTKGAYMIYLAIERYDSKPEYGTTMYRQFATDLGDISTYTEPEYMLAGEPENGAADFPSGAIDGDIIYDKINDRYIMYYNGQNIAVSDTIDGIYTPTDEKVFENVSAVEGSNIFKLNDEDKWVFCADGGSFGTGFNMAETTDFKTYTPIYPMSETNPDGYDYDFTPRHGYVVPITESELDELMGAYGYVELPDRFSDSPLEGLTLPYMERGYKIAGNITLPKEYNGTAVSWSSSDESVINTEERAFSEEEKAEYGENYSVIPAGVVTRPKDGDRTVTLTASAEKDGLVYTKEFVVTVKQAPEMNYKEMIAADEEQGGVFTGYLYASFIEPAVETKYQQVYFALSDDGLNWKDLNRNEPVLTSELGTKATRDHYIFRSAEGDRFYLIATDLDFANAQWYDDPSKNIMVWESDDLVNWSEQRSVPIANSDTHYAWAPEVTYDELTGEYIVYWSGKDITGTTPDDSEAVNVVFYSKTRDFYSFTPQQQFVYPIETDGEPPAEGELATSRNFIDTTMIQGTDGLYYRATKYEGVAPPHVFVDVAKYPLGEFKRIKTNLDARDFQGTEGPGWFRFNKDDREDGQPKYGLMLDGFRSPNKGVGFYPNTVPDLNVGWEAVEDGTAELTFTRVRDGFKMRTYAKHGGIVPITPEEYANVQAAYDLPIEYADTKPMAYAGFDFETEQLSDLGAVFTDGASLVDDEEKGSRVLYLDGTPGAYMELEAPKDSAGKTLERYTVSFDIKNNTTGNYFNFYIGDGSSESTGVNYFGAKLGDSILLSSKDGRTEQKITFDAPGVQGNWKHCDIVVAEATARIYIDGALVGEYQIFTMENSKASKIRFGFSGWSADNASNAYYDNIYIYTDALSEEALKQEDVPNPLTEASLEFNALDYWIGLNDTSKLSEIGWTSDRMPTFDGDNIRYIGVYPDSPVTMGEGYGKGKDWFALEFNLTSWAHGDYAVKDADGKYIFGDCYADDGYWAGHGERSFGGNVRDEYGVNRFENYIKTIVEPGSVREDTGKIDYGIDTLCTILVENHSGTVDDYEGDYYTVKVFADRVPVSTGYYKGSVNGIRTIENKGSDRNCFGNMKIYAGDSKGGDDVPVLPEEENMIKKYTYSFAEDVVYSDGTVSMGEVKELAIGSVPQYFYIDTVEANAIESVTIRSGYENNSAVTSVYLYDNGGAPVTKEQLRGFCGDNTALTRIASVADSKTAQWGYRTAVITADGVTKTEGDAYTMLDTSEMLDTGEAEGKLALIIGIEGDIASKAYFDYIKLEYNKYVTAPMPAIISVQGDGIKNNSVETDRGTRTVILPVAPGTDTSKLAPEIIVDGDAEAKLTAGTWADGTITVSRGSESVNWTVKCVDQGNPVLDGYYADPNIVCFGDTYYIYPTTDGGSGWNSTYFKAFSSKDLINWKDEGVILDLADVPWSGGINAWAPTIAEKDGKYYYYFSGKNKDNDIKSLGVAVADSPTGPFTAKETPLVAGGELEGQMIDPAVFTDDDGQSYIYWGNMRLYAAKLSDDMMSIEGDIIDITPQNFREASFVIKRNGTYYFFWSENDTGDYRYEVRYGTSDSPMGPIEGNTRILSYRDAEDPRIKGTAHCSILNLPGTDEWYICYHRFGRAQYGDMNTSSEAGNHRETCIDRLEFNEDGSIKTVVATLDGITEPVYVNADTDPLSIDSCKLENGRLSFEVGTNINDADIYIAVYGGDGRLVKLFKNELSGSIEAAENESYTVKAMAWKKGAMTPLCEAASATPDENG